MNEHVLCTGPFHDPATIKLMEDVWEMVSKHQPKPDYMWVPSVRIVRHYKGRRYVHQTDVFTAALIQMERS